MIRLETISGDVLSKILKDVSPVKYESNKMVNRLLDGTYHVQIIGQPSMSLEGKILSSHIQAEKLNQLIDQGAPLVFTFLDKKYIVFVDEKISWQRISFAHGNRDKSYFEGKLAMLIKEVVAL